MSQPVTPPSAPPPPSPPPTEKGRRPALRQRRRGGRETRRRRRYATGLAKTLRHGHAMMALLAILKPKLVPGERLVKKDLVSFVLSAVFEGLGLGDRGRTAGGRRDESFTGSLSSNSKSMKYSGSATRNVMNFASDAGVLQRQCDVELDQMVGPLLHPVIRHRAELNRLAADLQRREIADLGEAAGVFLGERGELLALDEFARLGEPLGREGRIHFVEHPVVDDRGDLAVGRERDLALHRHPDVRMGARRRRRREAERKPRPARSPIASPDNPTS